MSVNPLSGIPGLSASTSLASSSVAGVSSAASSSVSNPSSQLGESAFLTLLSAELEYQDPLQPMDNTQFVAELAQFSQLSATTTQTSTLNEILQAVQGTNSLVDASQLIGKVVTTQSGQSGEVTAIQSGSSGLSFEVAGIGAVQPSEVTAVSLASTSTTTGSTASTSGGIGLTASSS